LQIFAKLLVMLLLLLLQVIMFGLRKNGAVRIKQATMEFVVWVLKHASDKQMAAMAPLAFRGIIHLLQSMDPNDAGSGALQLRGFLYQATGQLAEVRCHSVVVPWRLLTLQ
jgi:Proteasome stabiliser